MARVFSHIFFILSSVLVTVGGVGGFDETTPPASAQTDLSTPRFEPSDCPFEPPRRYPDVACGYLIVPEDRTRPDSPTIRIAVAVYKSTADDPAPDPLIYLDGGPGAYTLEPVGRYGYDIFADYLATRDVILFDQRGIGYSEPSLDCYEVIEARWSSLEGPTVQGTLLENDALLACRDRLIAQGVDLSAYNSRENAADVVDLMTVLGYPSWNLLGGSYGTRLALTILRDYPDGVRSVILDAAYPPQVDAFYFTNAINFERAMTAVFAACAADESCDAAYPNLTKVFFKVIDLYNAAPITLDLYNRARDVEQTITVDGVRLLWLLRGLFYQTDTIQYLPDTIYELRAGDEETLRYMAAGLMNDNSQFSEGMHYAIACNEDVTFVSAESLLQLEAATDPRLWSGLVEAIDMQAFCEAWLPNEPAPRENFAVKSEVPTLVLAGEYDPVTPPAWGTLAAETLPNSYVFEFPGLSHGVVMWNRCADTIALSFLGDPSTAPDARCIERLRATEFYIAE